jgi:hypothetical protein
VIGALRPAFVAGAGMVLLGVLLFAHALGLLPGGVPVGSLVVIGIGVLFIVGAGQAQVSSGAATMPVRVDLAGAARARLVLKHGAGTISLRAAAAEGALLEGVVSGPVQQRVRHDGEVLDVVLQPDSEWLRWPAGWQQVTWELMVARDVPLDLEVSTGASQVRLDLSELSVEFLKVATGASDVEVVLPAHGQCRTKIDAGAASIRLRVPDGVAASVRNRSALASFTVDERRFPRVNGRFESPDYAAAPDRVDIDVDGGVASFSVG